MILSREDKKQLLDRFPSLELSYENVLHKKVCAELYMLIPKGQKAFVWFTYWQDLDVCLVLLLNDNNNICDVKPYPVCFDAKLSLNTVIYGTIFSNNNLTHFSCEQLFYYKGTNVNKGPNVNNYSFLQQLALFKHIFSNDIKQVAYTPDFLILGIPIIKTNYDHALFSINGLSYKVHAVSFINNNDVLGIYKINKPILQEATFKVKSLVGADIYELYCNDRTDAYSIAFIPSYKSSVMMNSLFRHIKENSNLDLLEESDSEEEYENTNVNKFVNMDKTYNMRCVYIRKFRKWQPIEVVYDQQKQKITSYKEVQMLEKATF